MKDRNIRRKTPRRSSGTRFLVVPALVLVFALSAVLFFYAFFKSELLDSAVRSLAEIARQGAGAVKENLDSRFEALAALAATAVVTDSQVSLPDKIGFLGDTAGKKGYRLLLLSDRTGKTYDSLRQVTNQSANPQIQDALLMKPSLSDPFAYGGPMQNVFAMSVPIRGDSTAIGVLTAYMDAEVLHRIIATIGNGSGSVSFLLDSSGNCIATANESIVRIGQLTNAGSSSNTKRLSDYARFMVEGRSGSGAYRDGNITRYIGYAAIGNTGWSLGVTVPEQEILGRFNRLSIWLMIISLFVSLLMPVLAWQFTRQARFLRKQRRLASQTIRSASLFLIELNRSMIFQSANDGFSARIGKTPLALAGTSFAVMTDMAPDRLFSLLSDGKPHTLRLRTNEDAEVLHVVWHMLDEEDSNWQKVTLLGVDITERMHFTEQLQEQQAMLEETLASLEAKDEQLTEQNASLLLSRNTIRHMAFHDELTGLPNRSFVYAEYAKILSETQEAFLYYLDSDRFKMVNDTYGHDFGDRLIRAIADRLRTCLGDTVPIARMGGDEFIVLVPNPPASEQRDPGTAYGERILCCFQEPITVDRIKLELRCSIGCALFPAHGRTIGELLKHADLAMYRAKESGRGMLVVYSDEIGQRMDAKMDMENRMRRGLSEGEFVLWQQPQYRIREKASAQAGTSADRAALVGFETLLRWFPADGPPIPPSEFIPLAEENGKILDIGHWVMEKTFEKAAGLLRAGIRDLHMSCNVSGIQLRQPDFTRKTLALFEQYGLPPGIAAIEITESCLIEDFGEMSQKLATLRTHGIAIHLDDFGTGFSSLNYLKQLPVDLLKLDRSFIAQIHRNPMDRGVVENIIRLSHDLGLEVVAEGVEEQAQLSVLQEAGCDLVQGYLTGYPMDDAGLAALLEVDIRINA